MGGPFQVRKAHFDREPLALAVEAMAHGSWDPAFQNDVREGALFMTSRMIALVSPGIDCLIAFGRVPLRSITDVNPMRVAITAEGGYPLLRERLSADPLYDSVPLSLGRSSRGIALWDGHRRMETYRAAGRSDVPAWVATFRHGVGLIRVG